MLLCTNGCDERRALDCFSAGRPDPDHEALLAAQVAVAEVECERLRVARLAVAQVRSWR
jgi:hypothetical protein